MPVALSTSIKPLDRAFTDGFCTVTPDPGKSMFVDYPSTTSVRQQIRVTISISRPTQMAPSGGSPVAIAYFYCALVPTLEVFDNSTSKTTFVVSDFHYVLAYPMPLMGGGDRSRPDAIDLNRGVWAER